MDNLAAIFGAVRKRLKVDLKAPSRQLTRGGHIRTYILVR
jgi:hypothetical protein